MVCSILVVMVIITKPSATSRPLTITMEFSLQKTFDFWRPKAPFLFVTILWFASIFPSPTFAINDSVEIGGVYIADNDGAKVKILSYFAGLSATCFDPSKANTIFHNKYRQCSFYKDGGRMCTPSAPGRRFGPWTKYMCEVTDEPLTRQIEDPNTDPGKNCPMIPVGR